MATPETAVLELDSFIGEAPHERVSRLRAYFKQIFSGDWAESEVVADPESVAPSAAAHEGWENRGIRGQVALELRARGDERRALRYANCYRFGRPGACSRYLFEHKYFLRHGCGIPFCSNCAQEERRRLFHKYLAVLTHVLAGLTSIPEKWVLAQFTFTLRSDGSEVTPAQVMLFNNVVRSVMKGAVRIAGGDGHYGALFIDEVGAERHGSPAYRKANGLNLHCHGIYLGPRLDWGETRDLWVAITTKVFGVPSDGVYMRNIRWFAKNPIRAARVALGSLLKYASKPPAASPERLADLICAFAGTRRVHALGMFYGVRIKKEKVDIPCPHCQKLGIPSTICFEGRSLSNGSCIPRLVLVPDLEADGYRDLQTVRRELFFSQDHASP